MSANFHRASVSKSSVSCDSCYPTSWHTNTCTRLKIYIETRYSHKQIWTHGHTNARKLNLTAIFVRSIHIPGNPSKRKTCLSHAYTCLRALSNTWSNIATIKHAIFTDKRVVIYFIKRVLHSLPAVYSLLTKFPWILKESLCPCHNPLSEHIEGSVCTTIRRIIT